MKFTKSGGQTATGPADWFTGTVYIDGIRNPDDQSAVGCAHVRFTPGARTAWHSHPKGQTLYVTDGIGYVARRGGDVAGDPSRRRRLHRAERGALARRHPRPVHGARRHPGSRRPGAGRDLARPRHRRRVRHLTARQNH